MKLLILAGLLSSAYSIENDGYNEYKTGGRQIAGGGNYGGLIGLTTYPAGPFLVKGKYERDNVDRFGPNWNRQEGFGFKQGPSNYNDGSQKHNKQSEPVKGNDNKEKKINGGFEAEYINLGYEDVSRDQSYFSPNEENGKRKNHGNLEYLGYSDNGLCLGDIGDNSDYAYGRRGYGERNEFRINKGKEKINSYYDEETTQRCDNLFGYTGPTANDEEENLLRPCALDDWQCIRKYFAANSKCKPAYGPIPDPLYIKVNTFFFPLVNLTVALSNPVIRGLSSAKIRDFYVNKKSGNLLFAIDVLKLNETIPRAYFRYRRTAKESIVLADYATIETISAITLTAVIPKVPNLRLDLADVHAFAQDSLPPFFIGPGAFNSTDPDVVSAFTQFLLQAPLVGREALFFQAQLLTAVYIQENICDFGLKLISV